MKCFEIEYFNKLYPKFRYEILNHNFINYLSFKYHKFNSLIKNINENKEFKKLMKYKKFDFKEIFEKQIEKITYDFSFLLKEYRRNKIFFKNTPRVFIFGSSNPFYLPNVCFRKLRLI